MPVFILTDELIFPDPELAEPEGLLAVGGDLSPERLILAYKNGIFPWFDPGEPILWWSPDPRLVLFPDELHVPKRLLRNMRREPYTIKVNEAFKQVMIGCKETREKTWITDEMVEAYTTLHKMGYAHSIEAWDGDRLVGGLYGVLIGKVFSGESMFTRAKDASKIAFVKGVELLKGLGVKLIDCQVETGHLMRFGARPIPRQTFIKLLKKWT